MKASIIKLLEEADELLKQEIKSAHNGMRAAEEDRCSKAKSLVQEAIIQLLRCGG